MLKNINAFTVKMNQISVECLYSLQAMSGVRSCIR